MVLPALYPDMIFYFSIKIVCGGAVRQKMRERDYKKGNDDLTPYRSSNNGCGNVWGFVGRTSSEVLNIVTENQK